MELKVVFDWKTNDERWLRNQLKSAVEEKLINLHNMFSEEVNKRLDAWNKESEDADDYEKFMHGKYDELLTELCENDKRFKGLREKGLLCESVVYIGEEFELHYHLKVESIFSDYWFDVSFHLEKVA